MLTFGCFDYDTTRALFDGSVTVEGADVAMDTAATLPEIFERTVVDHQFDISELGLTFYLRMLDSGDDSYVALPAFPNRVFRHSCVFVNADSGIAEPADLVDRTIGEFGTYGQDSGVWAKGILADEYGFQPARNRWVIGGLDHPMAPFDFIPHPHPTDLNMSVVSEGSTLSGMLVAGELDALFTANIPQPVLDGSPKVKRLFVDFEPIERDYFRRTGIFPMMHTVVARRELLDRQPELAAQVYRALLAAKDCAAEGYRRGRRLYEVQNMVPWMDALFDKNRTLFGDDWFPYGVEANRTAIDTYLRYHHEQGLSPRRWTIDEIFAADLLDT